MLFLIQSSAVLFNVNVMPLSVQMDSGRIIMMELGLHVALVKDLM